MKETIEKLTGRKVRDVVLLHSHGSYRSYFRAFFEDGTTRVVMQIPEGKWSVSDEVTNFDGRHEELPFINVQRFLLGKGLPVPKIFEVSEKDRMMMLEDLGDDMMISFVSDASAPVQTGYYKKAIDLLVKMQKATSGGDANECVAFRRSFDARLLNWELDHFREYLIEERLGMKMPDDDRTKFEKLTRKITEEILKMPQMFVHRDFQSKNLIVMKDGSLSLIDFQDALMGSYVYDLVALLRDSYVELEWGMVEELIGYYKGVQGSKFNVQGDFDLVTLQRKMKDAGRFVFIDRVKKNPSFLQYIPTTLRYVRMALERTGRTELLELLKRYVPEWK